MCEARQLTDDRDKHTDKHTTLLGVSMLGKIPASVTSLFMRSLAPAHNQNLPRVACCH